MAGKDFLLGIRMRADWRQTRDEARDRLHRWLEHEGHTSVSFGFDFIEVLHVVERGKHIATKKRSTKKRPTKAEYEDKDYPL